MTPDRRDIAAAVLLEKLVADCYQDRAPGSVSRLQWSILRCLGRAEPAEKTSGWIARYVGVTAAPTSRAIRALEEHGLVTLSRSAQDGRQLIVELSDAGQEALSRDPLLRLAGSISKLGETDRISLQRIVQILGLSGLPKE